MTEDRAYRAPAAEARAELREKGSRFLAVIHQVRDETSALANLEESRGEFPGATHHCWAWRLGPDRRERSSDDGEPAGTAGAPILNVLRGADLSDVLAVVVRWFGGTKLGKGGLARAYSGVVRTVVPRLSTVERFPTVELTVEVPYPRLGAVKRLVHPPEVVILEQRYGEGSELVLRIRSSRLAKVEQALASLGLSASRPEAG